MLRLKHTDKTEYSITFASIMKVNLIYYGLSASTELSDNMSVGNHHNCSLLIMLRQFQIIPYGRISFNVIYSEECKVVRRYTDRVKFMKKWRAYFIPAINSQIIHLWQTMAQFVITKTTYFVSHSCHVFWMSYRRSL